MKSKTSDLALFAQVAVLTPCSTTIISPPSVVGGGQELAPGEEQSFCETEFLGDDGSGFATAKPVADSLALEGGVELAAGFWRGFFDGLQGNQSPFLTVREIEATAMDPRGSSPSILLRT